MKNNFTYLILALLVLTCGCFNNNYNTPAPSPSGTFTGTFKRIHRANSKAPIDSLKANINLVLDGSGNYTVAGDTAVVHAGSLGKYYFGTQSILFVDNTYPKTGTPSKVHLNGQYLFAYNGTAFQMVANSLDTLTLQYDLKRVQ